MNILCIDIGGSTTKRAIIDSNGALLKKYSVVTSNKGHDLKWLFDSFIDIDLEYDYISIDVPGFYNKQKKILSLSGNLEYRDFDIISECKKYTNKEVFILNDANAAALGEYWKLDLGEHSNAIFYIIGTGIGGGIIIDGKLYEGSQGYAGEFGHGRLLDASISCNCGLGGCIEPSSSAKGITRKINEFAKDPKNVALHELWLKKQALNDTIHLYEIPNFVRDDKPTIQAIKVALGPLIKHMSIMTYALNPEAIIIGGGPTNCGQPFLDIINELYREAVADWLIPTIDIVLARQLNDAALYGCAYYALTNINK